MKRIMYENNVVVEFIILYHICFRGGRPGEKGAVGNLERGSLCPLCFVIPPGHFGSSPKCPVGIANKFLGLSFPGRQLRYDGNGWATGMGLSSYAAKNGVATQPHTRWTTRLS